MVELFVALQNSRKQKRTDNVKCEAVTRVDCFWEFVV